MRHSHTHTFSSRLFARVVFAALVACGNNALAQSLVVPPASRVTAPQGARAWLSAVQGQVEVLAPEAHAGSVGEALAPSTRVRTGPGASARVTLENGSSLALGEQTTVVMFATLPGPEGTPPAVATVLSRGQLRAVASPQGDQAALLPIATNTATVFVGRSDSWLHVDLSGVTTRVAVHRGRMRVRSGTREYILRAGQRVIETASSTETVRLPLLRGPQWVTPPERVFSPGGPVDVTLAWAPVASPPVTEARATPPSAAKYRVVLARDERFEDVVAEERVNAPVTRWTARALGGGAYYARVTAIDHERFEGQPSTTTRFVVASPRLVEGALASGSQPGRRARLEVPDGFFCSLDGGLMLQATTLFLEPGRAHRVRCSTDARERTTGRELVIPESQSGPLVWEAHVLPSSSLESGLGVLAVHLRDAEGHPVPWVALEASASDGVTIEPVREEAERGRYAAAVHWPVGTRRARFHLVANGGPTHDFEATP